MSSDFLDEGEKKCVDRSSRENRLSPSTVVLLLREDINRRGGRRKKKREKKCEDIG